MITVKLNDVINATDTFSKIIQQPFKGSLAFKIARLVRELEKEMQTFNTERQKLLTRYCVKDENNELITAENGTVQIIPDKVDAFNEEFDSLLNTELEINADKLPINAIDDFELTPQEMLNIEVFFEE